MVQMRDNIVGIDAAILCAMDTESIQYVDAFNDPLIDNKDSKKRYCADVLIEEHMDKLGQNPERGRQRNARWSGENLTRRFPLHQRSGIALSGRATVKPRGNAWQAMTKGDLAEPKQLIEDLEIAD